MEPDQSRPPLCHPSLRVINRRLLQCISCMCLPCGSSLKLTHAASKHSPRVVLKCHPDGSLLMGEGLGRRGPGTVCTGRHHFREGTTFSRWQKSRPSFPALRVWLVWGSMTIFSFLSFLKKPISVHPIPGKTTIPQQSPRPSAVKNTYLPCYPLLLWIGFEQQLISV